MEIERKQERRRLWFDEFPTRQMCAMVNTVNAATAFGYPAGTVFFRQFSAYLEICQDNKARWRCDILLDVDQNGFDLRTEDVVRVEGQAPDVRTFKVYAATDFSPIAHAERVEDEHV